MMSSNSALTSSEFTVVSANILSDELAERHAPQAQRVPRLAHDIAAIKPDVLFVCEGASDYGIRELASLTDLELAGNTRQYSEYEYMGIAVKPALKDLVKVSFINYGRKTHRHQPAFLVADLPDARIIGVHHPYHPLRDVRPRREGTLKIEEHIDPSKPTLVMGDMNAERFQLPYRRLANRLTDLHQGNKPKFPTAKYRGVTFKKWWLPICIDAMFASDHFSLSRSGALASDADHHILWARLVLKGATRNVEPDLAEA